MATYKLNYSGEKIDEILAKADNMTEVGSATGTTAGKVKLSDATNSESGVAGGTAATPKAVKAAYDAASAAAKTADDLSTKVEKNTTDIAKNATDVSKLKEDTAALKDGKISKFYASSQGNTNLPDSDDGRIMDLKLYGRSEQKQYSGKNLLEDGSLKSDNNGKIEYISAGKIKVTASTSAWYSTITNTLNLTPNTNYVLSAKCDSSNGRIVCNSVTSTGTDIKCAFSTDSDGLATIAIRCRYESAETKFIYSELQLEKGSTATAYEPYVGGIPSPNPEYPQGIKSVVNPIVTISDGADKQQTATLPYTLNAIPVISGGNVTIDGQQYIADYVDVEKGKLVRMVDSSKLDTTQSIIGKTDWLLATPTETDLTADEIAAFKALVSYYPVTNVACTSDQLDGYTVFNYPISLADGWNYVKKQLSDSRDYIYDMDTQSAEAYVNSEYAVALTELGV